MVLHLLMPQSAGRLKTVRDGISSEAPANATMRAETCDQLMQAASRETYQTWAKRTETLMPALVPTDPLW